MADSENAQPSDIGAEGVRHSFDDAMVGRPCTCEGGEQVQGAPVAGRATYIGVLTGRSFVQGDPPWRWLEMVVHQTDDPSAAPNQLVWCEENFVFMEDEA